MVGSGLLIAAYSLIVMSQWSLMMAPVPGRQRAGRAGDGLIIPLNTMAFATIPMQFGTDGRACSICSAAWVAGHFVVTTLLDRIRDQPPGSGRACRSSARSAPSIPSTADRFGTARATSMQMVINNGEINRQAAMVAHIDDFWLMMWSRQGRCRSSSCCVRSRPGAAKASATDMGH